MAGSDFVFMLSAEDSSLDLVAFIVHSPLLHKHSEGISESTLVDMHIKPDEQTRHNWTKVLAILWSKLSVSGNDSE